MTGPPDWLFYGSLGFYAGFGYAYWISNRTR